MAQMARAGEAEGSKRPGVAEGEAWATGLPSESFDVVNIRHVLAHDTPGDVRRILRHSLDLLVPGGAIYLIDVDLTGGRMDPPDEDLHDLLDRYVTHLRDTAATRQSVRCSVPRSRRPGSIRSSDLRPSGCRHPRRSPRPDHRARTPTP